MSELSFQRSAALLGEAGIQKLRACRVAVFGIGGVGGYTVEALARSGVGHLDLIDSDRVNETNINRQIIALHSTVGEYKTAVAARRIKDICPETEVTEHRSFFLPENADEFDFTVYDYIVDAVDTVAAKLALVQKAYAAGVPIISCLGTGNKLDPTRFTVTDIFKTKEDPLARVMRARLRKMGIPHLRVVYSDETPYRAPRGAVVDAPEEDTHGRHAPASCSFVPPVAGMILAGEVVKALCL